MQGSARGGFPPFRHMLPMLSAENPSASFSTRIASSTVASLMCFGSGSCTRIPCTCGSAFKSRTHWSSSSSVTLSSNVLSTEWKATSAAAFFFMRTYVAESVLAPTRTTASPGVTPCCSFSSVACCLISARISAEIALPSMIVAPSVVM